MKRFLLKFIIAILILLLPALWYQLWIVPKMTGDLGRLGMIPFGLVSEDKGVSSAESLVHNTSVLDSLKFFKVVTIGDSFSQMGENGYQVALSEALGEEIINYHPELQNSIFDPIQGFISAVNGNFITEGQTVVLENVERCVIGRFADMDTTMALPSKEEVFEYDAPSQKPPFLYRYFSWLRLMLGIDNPVRKFPLTKTCFTLTPPYDNSLFVVDSKADSDLQWEEYGESDYSKAYDNMLTLIEFSERKGINLVSLIATDKYDAYEPWIATEHKVNPTLDRLPIHSKIFDARPFLRKAIENDVKDVYWVDNTHWSEVGAKIVGEALSDRLKTASKSL